MSVGMVQRSMRAVPARKTAVGVWWSVPFSPLGYGMTHHFISATEFIPTPKHGLIMHMSISCWTWPLTHMSSESELQPIFEPAVDKLLPLQQHKISADERQE